jgi:hypothetical protein
VFSTRRNHRKIRVILLSSHTTDQEDEVLERRGPIIISSYNKFMGGIDSSDMILYAYLNERQTVHYWKKVAFNIIATIVLNSYIL